MYYSFDPGLQRYQAMKVNYYSYFKPTFRNACIGMALLVVPMVGYGYLLQKVRGDQEFKYRTGRVAYKDRMHKFK
ncbi:hypothetical protein NQ318_000197 [Aromia moschata]|uniref:NADH dehydrogenase [ubiquinone] 1 beta subcomplex subunit 4 n=1 Tax=Aromia moschata TaxID=1265417 RepID=A0AAV8YLP0_9CUCU|nr:hypothetical protein NQ318_000197 [Aromia moschata]